MNIRTTIDVDIQRIADLLCSALEGGSNYWYMIEEFNPPKDTDLIMIEPFSHDEQHKNKELFRHLRYPLSNGGSLIISDATASEEPASRTLDLTTIANGLQTMADKYPKHFADFLTENDDAITGDVFLQCCLFDEVIYG